MKHRTITLYVIRHGEKPDADKKSNDKYSGLTLQGGVRAYHYFSSNFIKDTIGDESYDIYTYGNYKKGAPSSRAYYTVKPIIYSNKTGDACVTDEVDDYKTLITHLKKTKNNKALICWEHNNIKDLIVAILGHDKEANKIIPEYNDLIKKYKKIDLTNAKAGTIIYHLNNIAKDFSTIEINGTKIELGDAKEREVHNLGLEEKDNTILSFDQDVGFSIMYEVVIEQNKKGDFELVDLKTYPNFVVEINNNSTNNEEYDCHITEFRRDYKYTK